MSQQIADLVVNLGAETARFHEQMGRVERQLKNAGQQAGRAAQQVSSVSRAEVQATQAKARFLSQLKAQLATQRLSREEMLRTRAAQLGLGDAAEIYIRKLESARQKTHSLGLESAAARRELGVLFGEMARGNFGALRGSGITLANNAGWLEKLMTLRGLSIAGVVGGIAAAVWGLGRAWYQGSQEAETFNRNLILTGHYAARTTSALQAMSRSLAGNGITQHEAASVLAEVTSSGLFNGQHLRQVADVAARLKAITGQATKETIRQFARLQDSPVAAVRELDKSLHFLTATELENITRLAEQGREADAAALAMDRYAETLRLRSADVAQHLGTLEKTWKWLGETAAGAWDAMLGIGRERSLEDQIAALQKKIDAGGMALGKTWLPVTQQDRDALSRLKEQKFQQDLKAAREKAERDEQIRKKRRFDADQALKKKYETDEEKHQRALSVIRHSWASREVKEEAMRREKQRYDTLVAGRRKRRDAHQPSAAALAGEKAQADMLALQARLHALKTHQEAGIVSQQRKDLWASQAKFHVLEEAAQKRQLTQEEKSLLAGKASVLLQQEKLAMLGDEVALQERMNQLQVQAGKFTEQQRTRQTEIAALEHGLSARDAQQHASITRLGATYAEAPDMLAAVLKAQQKTWQAEEKLRADWLAGSKSAWAEYRDAALDANSQIKQASSRALDGLSTQLSALLTDGKAGFRDFTRTVLSMLTQSLVKMTLVRGVDFFAGLIKQHALSFHAQGGVFHSPELHAFSGSVIRTPTLFAFAHGAGVMGEAGPEGIFPLRRGADGKLGVVARMTGDGLKYTPVFNVTIHNDGRNGQLGPEAARMMYELGRQGAKDFFLQQQRDGGMMSGGRV
ncbi:phage tail tape measure protein [Pantoea piersonii]|jgi:lambda family phage tail tape measure protein|uniref:phage tail tape measure protein n=2 Tax=Erwiniaceae TaxID=1903409 RepID=UPI000EA301A6|nr:phage tail tape measure protein [Pantoea piersonii]MBZ6387394.1 phage tail tape measure protein [Pantoea piersonii]MBZ6400705.1 phage tail tape measure protein [Pantoea piersonii]MBZ6408683.1 phage tail tape measure protein [Pantoea piersonii]NYB00591.1 phage tail tape measure protein [Pantoea piersonii]NYB08138.1 phage tail tape measure protein [Pantoea piersonii]